MSEFRFKEVYFNHYCQKCVHYEKDGFEEPCDECLTNAVNEFSHKPVNYISKEGDNND